MKQTTTTTTTKKLLFISVLTMAFSSMAVEPDKDAGEEAYNNFGCMGCHGMEGESTHNPTVPNLAGQNIEYTVKQLKDFASGKRKDPTMESMARMSAGNELDIAAFLYDLNK